MKLIHHPLELALLAFKNVLPQLPNNKCNVLSVVNPTPPKGDAKKGKSFPELNDPRPCPLYVALFRRNMITPPVVNCINIYFVRKMMLATERMNSQLERERERHTHKPGMGCN